MICYYRIVRELYTARSPDWIIGAARGGAGGRASAFVTGECVRAILAFEKSIRDTITFFKSSKRLAEEFKRIDLKLEIIDSNLKDIPAKHFRAGQEVQFQRLVLDWYAANNLRRNVIALDFETGGTDQSQSGVQARKTPLFPLDNAFGESADKSKSTTPRDFIEKTLQALPSLLRDATENARDQIEMAKIEIEKFRAEEAGVLKIFEIENLISFATKQERKKSLSKDFGALIDQLQPEVNRITEARRTNQGTEEHRKKLAREQEKLKAEYEEFCRQSIDRFITEKLAPSAVAPRFDQLRPSTVAQSCAPLAPRFRPYAVPEESTAMRSNLVSV